MGEFCAWLRTHSCLETEKAYTVDVLAILSVQNANIWWNLSGSNLEDRMPWQVKLDLLEHKNPLRTGTAKMVEKKVNKPFKENIEMRDLKTLRYWDSCKAQMHHICPYVAKRVLSATTHRNSAGLQLFQFLHHKVLAFFGVWFTDANLCIFANISWPHKEL